MATKTALAVGAIGVCSIFGYTVGLRHMRLRVSPQAIQASRALAQELEQVVEEPEEFLEDVEGSPDGPKPVRAGMQVRFVAAVALSIKAEYGVLRATEANRLLVVHVASRLMMARNTRKADIARLLPMVVVAVFTPTESEIEAHQMMFASPLGEALVRAETKYTGRTWEEWATQWWRAPTKALKFAQ